MDMNNNTKVQHPEQDARLEQDIVNAVRGRGLMEAMQQWDEEEKQRQREKKMRQSYRLKIAITSLLSPIAVAAVFAGVIFLGPRTWRNEIYRQGYALAHRYFHSPKPSKSTAQPFDDASRERFYATAMPSVQSIGERYFEDARSGHNSLVFEATAEMGNGRYDVALGILSDASEEASNHPMMADDIRYLEAICWYMNGSTKKARTRLQEIANSESVHKDDAQALCATISVCK